MTDIKIKGKIGEKHASDLLKKKGFKIIKNNFRSRFGEIDIIAEKNGHLYFCEVKTRWGCKYGLPEEAVTKQKIDKIRKTIDFYLYSNKILNNKIHILVISQIIDYSKSGFQKIIEADQIPQTYSSNK